MSICLAFSFGFTAEPLSSYREDFFIAQQSVGVYPTQSEKIRHLFPRLAFFIRMQCVISCPCNCEITFCTFCIFVLFIQVLGPELPSAFGHQGEVGPVQDVRPLSQRRKRNGNVLRNLKCKKTRDIKTILLNVFSRIVCLRKNNNKGTELQLCKR